MFGKKKKTKHFKWKPFSEKQLKVMTWWCDDSPVKDYDGIIADGAVRSGKTISMAPSFIMWAMERFEGEDFALCGKTISSLRRNVINTLKKQLKSLGYDVADKRSENLLEVSIDGKANYFYLFGGKDEGSQDLIQGMTLAGVFFDEVALMPQSFVSQAEARCSVEGAKFWYNCNPKSPSHYFYKEYLENDVFKEKHLLRLHFLMDDNLTLSEKVKERYKRMFAGVFYQRNILGLWVTAEGKIYISFSKDNVIDVNKWYERDAEGKYIHSLRSKISLATIGVDFGGNKSSTAFTLSLYTKNFQETIVAKEKRIKKEITPAQLEDMFVDFCKECLAEYPMVSTVYCDSAEQVLIRGLKNACARAKLPISIKNAKKGEIIDRIRFGITMFSQHRFFIVSNCKETIEAYDNAVWDDKHEDERLDDGTTNIDSLDATEYSQEPFIKTMIDLTRRK
ncbi:MAG: PBSX family phage terminase large subunit [Clostridium sp.]|nr:PBSX family phage terminase large subunit [Clostridium sp.]